MGVGWLWLLAKVPLRVCEEEEGEDRRGDAVGGGLEGVDSEEEEEEEEEFLNWLYAVSQLYKRKKRREKKREKERKPDTF